MISKTKPRCSQYRAVQPPSARVSSACDRCRIRKSKCDTGSPCTNCKIDNVICIHSGRRSRDKTYPKGYAGLLEQQQEYLITGLQILYQRLRLSGEWQGPDLLEMDSKPLAHTILASLGVMKGHEIKRPFVENTDDYSPKAQDSDDQPSDSYFANDSSRRCGLDLNRPARQHLPLAPKEPFYSTANESLSSTPSEIPSSELLDSTWQTQSPWFTGKGEALSSASSSLSEHMPNMTPDDGSDIEMENWESLWPCEPATTSQIPLDWCAPWNGDLPLNLLATGFGGQPFVFPGCESFT